MQTDKKHNLTYTAANALEVVTSHRQSTEETKVPEQAHPIISESLHIEPNGKILFETTETFEPIELIDRP